MSLQNALNDGWWTLQHHEPGVPRAKRKRMGAARRREPDYARFDYEGMTGNPEPVEGLVEGGLFWGEASPGSLEGVPSWWLTGPGIVSLDGSGPSEPADPTETQTRRIDGGESSPGWLPLRSPGTPDDRYPTKRPGAPAWADVVFPRGWTAQASAGTEEDSQQELLHPDFWGVVAVNKAGDPKAGTLVYDLDDEGNPDRWARLQSLVSVVDLGADGRALALQLGEGGRLDGGFGYGLMVDHDAHELGSLHWLRGGPLTTGGPGCQHPLGTDADGNTLRPIHLAYTASWWSPFGDGPMLFEGGGYDAGPDLPHRVPVHLVFDTELNHPAPAGGKGGSGYWRSYSTTALYIPPYTDPPPEPPPEESHVQPPPPIVEGPGTSVWVPGTGGTVTLPPAADPTVGVQPGGPDVEPLEPVGDEAGFGQPEDILDEIEQGNAASAAEEEDILDEIEETPYGHMPDGTTPTIGDHGGYKPAYPHSTSCFVLPNVIFKAMAWASDAFDPTGSTALNDEQKRLVEGAPHVGHLQGWGAGDGTWEGFDSYADGGPTSYPMAPGGVALLPPDVTMAEALAGTATTESPAQFGVIPGLAEISLATIDEETGGAADGVKAAGTTDGQLVVDSYSGGTAASGSAVIGGPGSTRGFGIGTPSGSGFGVGSGAGFGYHTGLGLLLIGLTDADSEFLTTGPYGSIQLGEGGTVIGGNVSISEGDLTLEGAGAKLTCDVIDPYVVIFEPVAAQPSELTGATTPGLWVEEDGNGTDEHALHYFDGTNDVAVATGGGAVPAGAIQAYAGSTAPSGWLACDGSAVSRTTYADLYSAIGTTWGTGDGSTTFNVPDLRGRALIGDGTGSGLTARTLGTQNIGAETHTLAESEMPAHTHTIAKGGTAAAGSYTAQSATVSGNHTSSSTGGGGAHNNMQPSAVVKFIIKT